MPDMTPGVASALSPLVRRIVAGNPGIMTGPGTNSYLVGIDEVAVIDPGPDDVGHVEAIVGASMKERVRWVLLTHTHPDHWPAADRIRKMTGAQVMAFATNGIELELDGVLSHGYIIDGTEFGLEVIHTPGHASNHVCLFLEEERALFTGDHIMNGSTVVIPPPDGNMTDYLASLEMLRKKRLTKIFPGHGDVIEEPRAVIEGYIDHRMMRERQILEQLHTKSAKIPTLVDRIYGSELHDELKPRAAQTVLAHLIKLKAEGKVSGRDENSIWKPTAA